MRRPIYERPSKVPDGLIDSGVATRLIAHLPSAGTRSPERINLSLVVEERHENIGHDHREKPAMNWVPKVAVSSAKANSTGADQAQTCCMRTV